MTTDNKSLSANDIKPFDEFRSVLVNLVRYLDARGGIKVGDKIKFTCELEKEDFDSYYSVTDVNLTINKPEQ